VIPGRAERYSGRFATLGPTSPPASDFPFSPQPIGDVDGDGFADVLFYFMSGSSSSRLGIKYGGPLPGAETVIR
jgi:hypothetical protein